MRRSLLVALLALTVAQVGCEDSETAPVVASGCKDGNTVGEVCAGVPNEPLTGGEFYDDGACTAVHQVRDDAGLNGVVAKAGECILLASGVYTSVVAPPGVSVMGRGADFVTIGSIEVSGANVRVIGLTIDGGGLVVADGQTTARFIRVQNSVGDGIQGATSASITVQQSEVIGALRYGVSAFETSNIDMQASIVKDGAGPGVWVQCSGGCNCTGSSTLSMANVKISGNAIVGLALVGTIATLDNVEIEQTTVGDDFQDGGGLSVAGCSELDATNLSILDNADFGMLVDDSKLDLDGATVAGNLRGMWLQNIGMSMAPSAVVLNVSVDGNKGVGIGVAGGSTNVSVLDSEVSNTLEISLPVLVNGVSASAEQVGDGLTWKGLSSVIIDNVSVSSSARASVLIDGEVGSGSSIANLTLSGGDEGKGIVQQSLPDGGASPAVSSAPPITTVMNEQFPVPQDVAIPPSI